MVKKEKLSGAVKSLFAILIALFIVVGYLSYSLFTSNAMPKDVEQTLNSLFHKEEEVLLFPLEEFTVKLSDRSYVNLSMSVGFVGKAEKIKELKPILRDKVIFELMKLDRTQLDVHHIEETKSILIEQLNPILLEKKASIKNIYIDNLVVQ